MNDTALLEEEEFTSQLPVVTTPETPATMQDFYVLASDLSSGGNPLASIPKWMWLAGAGALAYWYWKKHNHQSDLDLIDEAEEE
jgi:hypothetical protein